MNIAIIGSGMVGQIIAAKLVSLGHSVTIGTRDVAATRARTEPDGYGNPGFGIWHKAHEAVSVATFADAAAGAEVIINASKGDGSIEALNLAGAANLAGKPLIDIANPLDFSNGFPPSLSVVNTDSLGELIQRTFPDALVVKTLNTMNATVMVEPARVPGRHAVFVCGNDAGAKAKVRALLVSFGWDDIIDLGDITNARGTEQLLPIWVRLWGALGSADFNFAIARG